MSRATNRLIDPALIGKLARLLKADRTIQMITAASLLVAEEEIADPNIVKVVVDRAGDALYFSRSAIPFVRDRGVRPNFLPASRTLRLQPQTPARIREVAARRCSSAQNRSSNCAPLNTA